MLNTEFLQKLVEVQRFVEKYRKKEKFVGALVQSLGERRKSLAHAQKEMEYWALRVGTEEGKIANMQESMATLTQYMRDNEERYNKAEALIDEIGPNILDKFTESLAKLRSLQATTEEDDSDD